MDTFKVWLIKYWFIWIPALILIIGGIIWAVNYFNKPENQIKFGFKSDSNDNLKMLLPMLESRYETNNVNPQAKGIGVYLDVPLTAIVKNKSGKDISLQNIAGALSFEGADILQTKSNSEALKTVNVRAKTEKPVTDTFQILINDKTIKYIKEYLKGTKPKLNYNLSAKLFDNVYSFKDSAILNDTAPSVTGGSGASTSTTGRG